MLAGYCWEWEKRKKQFCISRYQNTTNEYRKIINNKQYSIYPLNRKAELGAPDLDCIEDTEPMNEQETA